MTFPILRPGYRSSPQPSSHLSFSYLQSDEEIDVYIGKQRSGMQIYQEGCAVGDG